MSDALRIRLLGAFEDFERLIPIQRSVWGHEDLDLTPVHQFCVSSRMGGIILGAFVRDELAGFVYSFPAVFGKKPCQHSHLLAVRPEFQGLGLGKALKRAQREEAARHGYERITWTFDPLQARNANLNLQALGAFSRTYVHNFYGLTPTLCLGPGIPTDRLLIEWPVRSGGAGQGAGPDVGKPPIHTAGDLPMALKRENGTDVSFPRPGVPDLDLKGGVLLAEIPRDMKALSERPAIIAEWQTGLRSVMSHYFGRGYRAEHFLYGDRCFYVLGKGG